MPISSASAPFPNSAGVDFQTDAGEYRYFIRKDGYLIFATKLLGDMDTLSIDRGIRRTIETNCLTCFPGDEGVSMFKETAAHPKTDRDKLEYEFELLECCLSVHLLNFHFIAKQG